MQPEGYRINDRICMRERVRGFAPDPTRDQSLDPYRTSSVRGHPEPRPLQGAGKRTLFFSLREGWMVDACQGLPYGVSGFALAP